MISGNYAPDTYNGNGATTSFAITFEFLDVSTNVKVSLKDTTTGVITLQTTPAQYSVSGSNVVFVTAPATGKTVILELELDGLQETDYREYDLFPAETHEAALDKLTLEAQVASENQGRTLKVDAAVSGFDATIVGTPAAGQVPVINDDEDGIEWTDAADAGLLTLGTGVSAFLETPTSANLAAAVTDETGTGPLVFATSPTLTTPKIGTIADTNGNEALILGTTASAVNEVTVTNAATGNAPTIAATGGDTNVSISLQPKGTGVVNILGTSTGQGEVRLFEDTDNGTNYTGFKAPATLAGNVVYTLPSADGTSGQVLSTNASGTLSWATASGSSATPTITRYTSGSGTYTVPANVTYLKIQMCGGGGGGAGGGSAGSPTNGTAGASTTFGSSLLTCTGGGYGEVAASGITGAGGTGTISAPAIGFTCQGGRGQGSDGYSGVARYTSGGAGGVNPFGGNGAGQENLPGTDGTANTGAGGGGGGTRNDTAGSGAGGSAGGYLDAIIASPSASYSYAVGAGGTGGAAGTPLGYVGGAGAAGVIIIWEYYN